jgi:VWFA-related protein
MMRVISLVSATLLIGTGIAQQPATQPPSSESSATFQSQSHEVLLEVLVRDAHGKLVTKVDPSQVSVFEDGVRQDIKSFRLVPGKEVRAEIQKEMAQAAAAPAEVTPVAPTTIKRSVSNPLRTVNVVCLILNDLNPETRKFAFDAARKFLDKEVRPNTFIGVFSLDASGLRPVFPFSNNRERLVNAINLASVNQLPSLSQSSAAVLNGLSMTTFGLPTSALTNTTTIVPIAPPVGVVAAGPTSVAINGPPPPGVPTAPDGSNAQDPLGARGDMGIAVNAGLREIDALLRMVKQLGQLPFQKTVLLMSTGLTRPPDQMEYWNSLIKTANQGGVTFYSLDVYGLSVCQDQTGCAQGITTAQGGSQAIPGSPASTPSSASVALLQATAGLSQGQSTVGRPNAAQGGGSSTSGPSPTAQLMESMHQTDYLRSAVLNANTQEALREIAESTGGFIIANTNNTDALLTKVMEDVDTHFELSYRPVSSGDDGRFHKIEVKVAGKDLRVQTRSGFYAVPDTGEGPLTPGDMGALEALNAKPRPHAFDFAANAYRFRPGKDGAQYSIAFEVPIANLTKTADANAKGHKIHAYLLAVVKNDKGEIVERVSKDVPSGVLDKYLAGLSSETMIYEHAVNLGPGHYTIEAAVVDQEGNRASTNVLQIDNREQPGPGLSDIALVRRVHNLERAPDLSDPFEVPGKRAQPFVTTTVAAGMQPFLYFVVYPEHENADAPSMRAQFLKNGRVIASQKSALPLPDASGAVPMAIQPIAGPGDYEVRVTIEQGHRSVERNLKYTIAAK